MRVFELADDVSVDLDEVIALRWSPCRPGSNDACVIVRLRDGSDHGRWWTVRNQTFQKALVEAFDREAAEWYVKVLDAWRGVVTAYVDRPDPTVPVHDPPTVSFAHEPPRRTFPQGGSPIG